ncbi:MAG: hypothetical protein IJ111_13595 [Eggerthellaceae bacterium]|nr:hypothetical protein [Eggerthellaceae bacterium]
MSRIEASRKLRECAEHGRAGFFANLEAAFGVPRYWCHDHVARPDNPTVFLAMANEIDREVEELVATLGGERGNTNYSKLFGTPERAAHTLSVMQRCELGIIGSCDECDLHDACRVRDGDYAALLEWLGIEAS